MLSQDLADLTDFVHAVAVYAPADGQAAAALLHLDRLVAGFDGRKGGGGGIQAEAPSHGRFTASCLCS